MVNSYLHNDSFPADHPLWCGPLGYQGSKAAMKLIAEADVVLALGTRLGPFGTLPQHGIDYWPKNAKIIQVDTRPPHARPGEADLGRRRAAMPRRRRRRCILPARQPQARVLTTTPTSARRRSQAEKAAWEEELERVGAREGRLVVQIAKGSPFMHPRQMLRELEKAHAEERHGLHRHRQYLLGVEQLSALQPAELACSPP